MALSKIKTGSVSDDLAVDTTTLVVDGTNNRVGVGTATPSADLHLGAASPHVDIGPGGGNRGKIGFDSNNVYIGSTSGTGEIHFKNNISSTDAPHSSGDTKMIITDSNLLMGVTSAFDASTGDNPSTDAISMQNGRIDVQRDQNTSLQLRRNGGNGTVATFARGGIGTVGTISVTTSATSYNTSSDHRLKENVVELTGATARLKQLEPKRFNFIADANTTVDGFLAHEVSGIVPEAITGTHNEVDADDNPVYQGIDQSKLVPLLVATIKELEARIVALEGA